MSSNVHMIAVAGIRVAEARLTADDGHRKSVVETIPLCPSGHNAGTPFCPKCGGAVKDIERVRLDVVTLWDRLLALAGGNVDLVGGGCIRENEGLLWELGQEQRNPEYVVGVPVPLNEETNRQIRSLTVSPSALEEAIKAGQALCERVALSGTVTLHVSSWISY